MTTARTCGVAHHMTIRKSCEGQEDFRDCKSHDGFGSQVIAAKTSRFCVSHDGFGSPVTASETSEFAVHVTGLWVK